MYKCIECNGRGLTKVQLIICGNCTGTKCYKCNESGYKQYPWIECTNCLGDGSITEEQANKLVKLNRFNGFIKNTQTKISNLIKETK